MRLLASPDALDDCDNAEARQWNAQGLDQLSKASTYPVAIGPQHGDRAVAIDDEAWHAVAFAMHDAVGGGETIGKKAFAEGDGALDALGEGRGVERCFSPDAEHDGRAGVGEGVSEGGSFGGKDTDGITG
jgi:hypothetical protein